MHSLELVKPDGRALTLYARGPIAPVADAPSPFASRSRASAHLRWHPLRGEWVTYAAHRQDRTFLPPPQYNPLAATADPAGRPSCRPGAWDVAVFDNRFPSLAAAARRRRPTLHRADRARQRPLRGRRLHAGPRRVARRACPRPPRAAAVECGPTARAASARATTSQYVLPFENRGVEVGATLHHPHGQIYAYPVVPPVPARMPRRRASTSPTHGRGLLERLIEARAARRRARCSTSGEHAVAFVPVCARYPVRVLGRADRVRSPSLPQLDARERADLARALKTVLLKYDGLWQPAVPYLMAWYQAPTDGARASGGAPARPVLSALSHARTG